jgi:hypothetical protein
MDQQQSQKRGLRSDAQKEERAREGYSAIPPSKPVTGAFGKHDEDEATTDRTDPEASLRHNTKVGRQTE